MLQQYLETEQLLSIIISCVAFYQASVSGLCDRPSGNLSVHLSVGRSLCVSAKCIVCGKMASGCGYRWDGEWGRSRYGCIRWDHDRQRGRGSFGVNLVLLIVTNGDFTTWLFPNYFGLDLFSFYHIHYRHGIMKDKEG